VGLKDEERREKSSMAVVDCCGLETKSFWVRKGGSNDRKVQPNGVNAVGGLDAENGKKVNPMKSPGKTPENEKGEGRRNRRRHEC